MPTTTHRLATFATLALAAALAFASSGAQAAERPAEVAAALAAYGRGGSETQGAPGCTQNSSELTLSLSLMQTLGGTMLLNSTMAFDRANQRMYQTLGFVEANTTQFSLEQWVLRDTDGDYKQTTVYTGAPGTCYVQVVPRPDWLAPIKIGDGARMRTTNLASTKIDIRELDEETHGVTFVTEHGTCMPVGLVTWSYNAQKRDLDFQHGVYYGQSTTVDATVFGRVPKHCIAVGRAPRHVLKAMAATREHDRRVASLAA